MIRVLIGLVIPFVAIDVLLPWANSVRFTIFDVPFVFLWLFSWFVLTAICLTTCWFLYDRHLPDS